METTVLPGVGGRVGHACCVGCAGFAGFAGCTGFAGFAGFAGRSGGVAWGTGATAQHSHS